MLIDFFMSGMYASFAIIQNRIASSSADVFRPA
jgi:hypothetical protein